ncbi:hypothetical protein EIN_017160 [Entamoeba invadens IP1]|uniref:hypothetical protein n=1 Tax=Entamoeba invadens IP1 TaxID=370355 RepID=UPI0002C3E07E|nr:hypothetical protein EIN_017160 [Entamoeba invadens IP1]ELP90447.1 hypothetical protein EIN_017160 [Entamoeba invadens IP1]|eukprot:XP_004257218.1 hypothetical protein EIN_017160 [Entamoeba invadens IP1]
MSKASEKCCQEIELSTESTEISTASSEEEDCYFESTKISEDNKEPNSFRVFLRAILFRMVIKQIMKGRRGNLTLDDTNPVPKNQNIEKEIDYYKSAWKTESEKSKPSIWKVIFKREWKNFLFMYIMIAIAIYFQLHFL